MKSQNKTEADNAGQEIGRQASWRDARSQSECRVEHKRRTIISQGIIIGTRKVIALRENIIHHSSFITCFFVTDTGLVRDATLTCWTSFTLCSIDTGQDLCFAHLSDHF
jgi:hypothetical protein